MSQPPLEQEEIDQQRNLLATYRRTLDHLVRQAAQYGGEVFVPPAVANGIFEVRENIRRIKAFLRTYGVEVEDQPDDEPADASATHLPARPQSMAPSPGEPPFKGLPFFDESDADMFFGREALVAKLAGRIREQRFLAVVGASGSGKSSIVRAGLIPALRRGQPLADDSSPPHGSEHWPIHQITPTAHPLEALAASLTHDVESVTATTTLIDDLARDPRSLHLAVRRRMSRIAPAIGDHARLLVIVDQFEEIFTLCKDPAERKAFVDNLLTAVMPELSGPTVVVLAIRADFYDQCGQFADLRAALERQQVYIGSMSTDELRRAIEEPARQGGWIFEPGLVDLLLREAGGEPGALPLLSHALLETWKRRSGRLLTLHSYIESGGVRGAIAKTAETIFDERLTPEQQKVVRQIFGRLTSLGEGTQDTRRRATLNELIPNREGAVMVESTLRILANARLVTIDRETVEVAHEALIREWPLLRLWLTEDREGLRLQHQLAEAAREWQRLDRDEGVLYRGSRLAAIEEWVRERPNQLTASEQEFLDASRALRQHELDAIEERGRKELEDARRLAQEAEARVVAERRAARISRWLLGVTVLLTLVLAYEVRRLSSELDQLRITAVSLLVPEQIGSPMAALAGGTIVIGSGNPITQTKVTLQVVAFSMERTEVTNRQYRLCVQAGRCTLPFFRAPFENSAALDEYPVVNVTASQAAEYCAWLGRRLPTTVEWERAARGLSGRRWPWGDDPPSPAMANYSYATGKPVLVTVGSYASGATPEGILNLAGNAEEWTASVCRSGEDCSGIWDGRTPTDLAVRGGSWRTSPGSDITQAFFAMSTFASDSIGFRCVQSAPGK